MRADTVRRSGIYFAQLDRLRPGATRHCDTLVAEGEGGANELSANGDVQVVAAGRHRIVGGERSRMGPDYAEPGHAAGDAAASS